MLLITTKTATIAGLTEKRHISKMAVDPCLLKSIFRSKIRKISFNLMLITTDQKVFLLQRSESFHFSKVIKDLKNNNINFNLIDSLYPSEILKLNQRFFNFLPLTQPSQCLALSRHPGGLNTNTLFSCPIRESQKAYHSPNKKVYIFPGGHSNYNESIMVTLMRELQEEAGLNLTLKNLIFNQSSIFNVLIYDAVISRRFDNFVFPTKVDISSRDILYKFRETKHTLNPTFIDVSKCDNLFEAFILVQKFMLL